MNEALSQAVRDYWDKNVANWKVANELKPGSPAFFQEVERYRFEKLSYLEKRVDYAAYQGKHLLDVGCGLGTDLSRFAAGGAVTTGIDISPVAVELAKKNFAWRNLPGKFAVMDGEALTFPDDSFDFIYCHTVFHFTANPTALVAEIRRVLKPGGEALIMTINRRSWLYFLHQIAGVKLDYMDAPAFHKYSFDEFKQATDVFSQNDLIVERFPVHTEVHSGLKATLYNRFFVDFYNAMPNWRIGKSGYHLLSFVRK